MVNHMSSLNLSPIGSNGLTAMENLSLQSAQAEGEPSAAWYYDTLGASPNALTFNTIAQQPIQQAVQQPTVQQMAVQTTNNTNSNNYSWVWRYAISGLLVVSGITLLSIGYKNYKNDHKYYQPKS